ncbi:MAG TPA: manganese-binding transcriptional regulator MntR, partial [Verrucomicrobiae bacterium]|nr:manganese-binding transcriptional regulator MntR [Verrucomicrobiae bacterium]
MSTRRSSPPPAATSLHRSEARQAENLRHTRRERAAETAEDYVEAIADLSASMGEARVVDLARRLGVTHVTVNRTIARLKRDGYVNTKPYRAIFLTERGCEVADKCRERHDTVLAFLRRIGVPERAAELDAEGIEHHVSPDTLRAFQRILSQSRRAGLPI